MSEFTDVTIVTNRVLSQLQYVEFPLSLLSHNKAGLFKLLLLLSLQRAPVDVKLS
jgi:hypothetical protein